MTIGVASRPPLLLRFLPVVAAATAVPSSSMEGLLLPSSQLQVQATMLLRSPKHNNESYSKPTQKRAPLSLRRVAASLRLQLHHCCCCSRFCSSCFSPGLPSSSSSSSSLSSTSMDAAVSSSSKPNSIALLLLRSSCFLLRFSSSFTSNDACFFVVFKSVYAQVRWFRLEFVRCSSLDIHGTYL
ncbi:uncharacterized protein LOC142176813 [Nicotiana tabacum]|uniref:Uncharacterized protein LOC142176813 n=1 Tax=Nicotiana tabacum TaxID=4097 RepID=A0AC58TVM9_TOBAC